MVQSGLDRTREYDLLLGKRTNAKSTVFSSHKSVLGEELASLHYGGKGLRVVDAEKLLGVEQSFRLKRARGLQERRADTCVDTCRRARAIARPLGDRALLLAATASSQFVFGGEFAPPRVADIQECRRVVTQAVWGTGGAMKSVEGLYCVLLDGHRVDPPQRLQIETLEHFTRLARKHRESSWNDVAETWSLVVDGVPPRGPVGAANKVLREIGWEWTEPHLLTDHQGRPFRIVDEPKSYAAQRFRDGARCAQLHKLRGRPRVKEGDMQGLLTPDLASTTALWKDRVPRDERIDEEGKRLLSRVITGTFRVFALAVF